MAFINAFVSFYFKINNFYQEQSMPVNEQKHSKVGKLSIEHFLFEICLGTDTIKK